MMWTGHRGVKVLEVCMRISRVNACCVGLVDTREWDQRTRISRLKVMSGNHADTTTDDRYFTSLETCIPIRTSTVPNPYILHNPSHLGPT